MSNQELFLYRISQPYKGYDTYDSAVVVAASVEDARVIHPEALQITEGSTQGPTRFIWDEDYYGWINRKNLDGNTDAQVMWSWAQPKDVRVVCIGKAAPSLSAGDVVCSSFNAG